MTTSDPQATAEEVAAQAYTILDDDWIRDYLTNEEAEMPERLLYGTRTVAALRDDGFIVTRLDEATKEAMVEAAAIAGHCEYEERAPDFGWETRPETRVRWAALPPDHKELMRAAYEAGLDAALSVLTDSTDQPVKET